MDAMQAQIIAARSERDFLEVLINLLGAFEDIKAKEVAERRVQMLEEVIRRCGGNPDAE